MSAVSVLVDTEQNWETAGRAAAAAAEDLVDAI